MKLSIVLLLTLLTGMNLYSQNIHRPIIHGPAGLSVNSYTLGLFYERTDLEIPCQGLSISITFYYNSGTTGLNYGYGNGWTMNYSMKYIRESSTKIYIIRGNGRREEYNFSSGAWHADLPGFWDELSEYESGMFKLKTKEGTSYFFENSDHKRLTKISDRYDNNLSFSYTDSLITTITDHALRNVLLEYDDGNLTKITDPNTFPPRYFYYNIDSSGNLKSVTDPLNNSIRYSYDFLRRIIMLTDKSSNQFTVKYYELGVESIGSPIDTIFFLKAESEGDGTTVRQIVNGVEQNTNYRYARPFGSTYAKISNITGNCCGFKVHYAYDNENNVSEKHYGISSPAEWKYEYDLRGNVTKETDPLGHETEYTYEPVYNKMTSMKDKRGNITTYIYDEDGNLLQEQKPLGVTKSYTYDYYGNTLTHTDGNGNTTQYEYNKYGYLTLITYPDTTTNSFTYDEVGNKISFTDANGNTTFYTYDLMNRLKQTTDALMHSTHKDYDGNGNLTSEIDELGRFTRHVYDALNRKTSTTTPAGIMSWTYDEKGNKLTKTDRNGFVTRYTYDLRNQLVAERNALGHTKSYGYDQLGHLDFETDFSGNVTDYTYDLMNRLKQKRDALSHTANFDYDPNGNLTSTTDENGNTTNYYYDELNRMIKTRFQIGSISFAYDNNSNQTSVTNANGKTTQYVFDNRDRQTLIIDALNHTTDIDYDDQGNMTSVTDRNGNTTVYRYDALNRKREEENAENEITSITFDAVGNVLTRTLPTNNVITYIYDASNRMTSASDLSGLIGSYNYDPNSNRVSQTDANGNTTINKYDPLNRLIRVRDPMGRFTSYTYNNNSSMTTMVDRNGKSTVHTYDVLERKTSTTTSAGNLTTMTYDHVGNTKTITDDNGHTTEYTYDANNRLKIELYENGTTKNYAYDNAGNLLSRKDNNGKNTTYKYDALNRLVGKIHMNRSEYFTYDNEMNMMSALNVNANISFTYDDVNRKVTETMNRKTTGYVHDIANRKRIVTYPGGRVVTEDYDSRMRLSAINSGVSVSYSHDAADRMLSRGYSNGVIANFSYNNNNWITSVSHVKVPTTISQFNYTLDGEGNRLTSLKGHRTTNSEKYDYDGDYKLTDYKEGTLVGNNIPSPVTQTQFNYDGIGNRTTIIKDALTTTYTVNNVNAYTSISDTVTVTPDYDFNGNTLNDGRHDYAYDFENRLISVDGGTTATYKYDALGRRIQKVTSAGTINYYYDDQRVIEERNASDAVEATYIYGTWIDDILSMRRSGTDYFYHQNSLGSVVAVTNSSGTAVERYEYDAYGKPSIYNGSYTPLTATAIGNTYMFTGREYDAETKNYHYRARFYKPDWGRFGQWDPLVYVDGMNLYGYGKNNPVNYLDPKGTLCCESEAADAIFAAFALAAACTVGAPTPLCWIAIAAYSTYLTLWWQCIQQNCVFNFCS